MAWEGHDAVAGVERRRASSLRSPDGAAGTPARSAHARNKAGAERLAGRSLSLARIRAARVACSIGDGPHAPWPRAEPPNREPLHGRSDQVLQACGIHPAEDLIMN